MLRSSRAVKDAAEDQLADHPSLHLPQLLLSNHNSGSRLDLDNGDVDVGISGSPGWPYWPLLMRRERLALEARRQHSMLLSTVLMLPCIRGGETEWPPLWPFRRSSGALGIGNPEFLYPR